MQIEQAILENKLRVIVATMPDVRSVATMLFVGAGSRYEENSNNGISHFLEHMVFKGTKKYPDQLAISRAIEGIGGRLNAWTDQDHTNFYNIVPARHAERGIEVVSELVLNPLLRANDLEKERGVILEEMNRRADAPEDYIWELAMEQMWPKHPLGYPVIGRKEVIKNIDIAQFKNYRDTWYRPQNMVLAICGNIEAKEGLDLAKHAFGVNPDKELAGQFEKMDHEQSAPTVQIYQRNTEQAHLVLGIKAFDRFDQDRYALAVTNAILGAGMSSRLFMEVREKRGLCYSIYSAVEHFADSGAFFVHAGLNTTKLEEAVSAISDELVRIKQKAVGDQELEEAKELLCGGLEMSADSTVSIATMFGKQALMTGEIETIDMITAKLRAVDTDAVKRVSERVFRQASANLAIIAPLSEKNTTKLTKKLNI